MAECAIYLLVDDRGRVLMEDRPDLKPGSTHYLVYPGGKIEYGESPVGAVVRELWEETGLILRDYPEALPSEEEFLSRPVPGTRSWRATEDTPVNEQPIWRSHPFLIRRWVGEVPAVSKDHNHAPLCWVDPRTLDAAEDDGYTAVNAITRALVAYLADQNVYLDAAQAIGRRRAWWATKQAGVSFLCKVWSATWKCPFVRGFLIATVAVNLFTFLHDRLSHL